MTQEHPITPPPELAGRIIDESETCIEMIRRAYQAGADQELEACKQAIVDQEWFVIPKHRLVELHNVRRPKPPTLKEQALEALDRMQDQWPNLNNKAVIAAHWRPSMTNPYRAMCAQLVDLLQPHVTKADSEISALGYYSQAQQFIDRTRCHLARSVDDDRRALEAFDD